jgi:hypothetical protein
MMSESLRLWADRIDRENRDAWASYETYCREIERATGAEHVSLVSSETHRTAQENLGLYRQYGLWELRNVLTKFSDEVIRKAVCDAVLLLSAKERLPN